MGYTKDGSEFLNSLQISPLYGPSGHVSHLLAVVTPKEGPAAEACG